MSRKIQVAAIAAIICTVTGAQDVGLGRRDGSGKRFEEPYTLAVATPHVKWANPLPGGPIRLLAMPTINEGRTLVELMQRLSLDVTTVSIDPHFDANKWTMCFGRDYGARADKGDLSRLYRHFEDELVSDKKFDVILLQLSHGWDVMGPRAQEAIARRVREGAGLVVLRPIGAGIFPLIPAEAPAKAANPYDVVEPQYTPASSWKPAADHYITRGIPIGSFPFQFLEEYHYRPSEGASVLAESASGNPIIAARTEGKGRVIAFGFRNEGLSWRMPMKARGFVPDTAWEYYYALLCRSLIFAAGREPHGTFSPSEWRIKSPDGRIRLSGIGAPPASPALPAGDYFIEEQSPADFRISALHTGNPGKIEDLRADADVISEGQTVAVTWKSAAPAHVELEDGFGRVIARTDGNGKAMLKAGRPLTHSGFITIRTPTAEARIGVRLAASERDWTDYEVIMPWYGPGSYQPWIPALESQFRKLGITTLSRPENNFKMIASGGLHDTFGVYAYRNRNYVARKNAFVATKDKKYLIRDVNLEAPDFPVTLRAALEERLRPLAPLHPLAYYIADESSLTSYTDAFDVDWSDDAIAAFRKWLPTQYTSLEALNASWGTQFKAWSEVVPMTTEEAQKHGNFAPWADHRIFMEQDFVRALGMARDIIKEIDPGALASISGTQVPTAHNGCNWYEIDQKMDYLQPYSGGNQDQMHYLFRPGIKLTGFTGYGLTGSALQHAQWQRLFYGHTGASIFWHYTILNPDLTFSEQGRALAETYGRIQSGIGRAFMNSTPREDGVAIHFSMASIRGAWITDGQIMPGSGNVMRTSRAYAELVRRRGAWVKELERQNLQFRFLATPQIERGELSRYKVLILPYSIAISDKEAAAIEDFMAHGGIVYSDDQTGKMDEHCHWRKSPLFSAERRGIVRQEPGPITVKPQYQAGADVLVSVRDFGASRLIGALPAQATRVPTPHSKAVTYNLLEGGEASGDIQTSPDKPALFVERETRISKLTLDNALRLTLTDEKGAPVDRSVVHVEVFDPQGNLIRYYSGNATVENGRARFEIPFALNDIRGTWKVRARDVISGLTEVREIRR